MVQGESPAHGEFETGACGCVTAQVRNSFTSKLTASSPRVLI
jgi:hypothetical protein